MINEDLGDDLDLIQPEHLGSCKKVITHTYESLIQNRYNTRRFKWCYRRIKNKINKTTNNNLKERFEKRLGRLLAKLAVIKVGANSEVELKEKRIE